MTDYVDSYRCPDDFTVEVKFKKVYTPSLYDLSNQYIVPEHIWKDIKDPVTFTNENPVGTGPFTEVTRFEDQIYIVEKNPHYWQAGKPYFQGLRYPAYPGNDQANLALVNGDLDWAGNFVPDIDKTYVSKDPENFHYYFPGGDEMMLYVNPALKPFDNPEVRKAISMGIDRKMVVSVAEFDYISPSDATGLSRAVQELEKPAGRRSRHLDQLRPQERERYARQPGLEERFRRHPPRPVWQPDELQADRCRRLDGLGIGLPDHRSKHERPGDRGQLSKLRNIMPGSMSSARASTNGPSAGLRADLPLTTSTAAS